MDRINLPEDVISVLDRLWDNGYTAYCVGGCVRDFLLGKTPSDYDIATSATPLQVTELFCDCTVIPTGICHGTVTVHNQLRDIEITTYRAEEEYINNRKPKSVRFVSDIASDLSRRDFTVNAIAYCHKVGFVDPYYGVQDVKSGIIRCVGVAKERFTEDGLRILRGIRFVSCLGFAFDNETAFAIKTESHLLRNISRERITAEFFKLIDGSAFTKVIRNFGDVIEGITGKIRDMDLVVKCTTEDMMRFCALAVLAENFWDFISRFTLSAKNKNMVKSVVEWYKENQECSYKSIHKLIIQSKNIEVARYVVALKDCLGIWQNGTEIFKQVIKEQECFSVSDLAVNGKDLIGIGIDSGKNIGVILNMLLGEIAEGRLKNTKEGLLDFANKIREQIN